MEDAVDIRHALCSGYDRVLGIPSMVKSLIPIEFFRWTNDKKPRIILT